MRLIEFITVLNEAYFHDPRIPHWINVKTGEVMFLNENQHHTEAIMADPGRFGPEDEIRDFIEDNWDHNMGQYQSMYMHQLILKVFEYDWVRAVPNLRYKKLTIHGGSHRNVRKALRYLDGLEDIDVRQEYSSIEVNIGSNEDVIDFIITPDSPNAQDNLQKLDNYIRKGTLR